MKLQTQSLKSFCINLDGRPDRWANFQKWWPDWLQPVVRYPAKSVLDILSPPEWPSSNGAWGCYQSHISLLQKCIEDAIDTVAIFEDDAIPTDDWETNLPNALLDVPDNWDMLYLGGQCMNYNGQKVPAVRVNHNWALHWNINRMHAYIIRQPMMSLAVAHLSNWNNWTCRHHCDHRMGELHEHCNVYLPVNGFIFGQAAGKSDITHTRWPKRFWNSFKTM